jgi:LacI family transcriptional regulator, repressor for deo operon, udp, cdd, tsx, nupC, and nupG
VLVNGWIPDVDAPFVSADDGAASVMAVDHLVALGHRRIGLITGPERYVPVQRRISGYQHAVKQHGTPELVELSVFTVEGGYAAAGRLLEQGVTGIVCGSDLMALGAIRAVRFRGLAVPNDVSVIGYDDSPLMAFTDPPLTTVRQPVREMSTAAVAALIDEINGHGPPTSEYVFRPDLVVRGTTGPPPRD